MARSVPFAGASALAACVVAVAAITLTGQSQGTQKPPVFRSGVDRVAVDFVAVANDGWPVPDITLDDITLKVDGKLRPIKSLEFVRLVPAPAPGADGLAPSVLPPSAAVPAPFGSNALADAGRAIILVFHHTSMLPGDERPAKAAAAAFIKSLTARDRVALITFQEGGVVVDLTTNHARVLTALAGVTGHKPMPHKTMPVAGNATTANETAFAVKNLVGLMNSFASIDGPKTVVFVSGGLPGIGGGDFRSIDRMNDFRDVGRAAGKVHAQLFILQAHSLGAGDVAQRDEVEGGAGVATIGSRSGVGDGLDEFAGVTGGAVFRLAASATSAFARVDRESSAYYLLGFDADSKERDGKYHKISVTASRPDLLVRARPEFLIAKPGTVAPAPPATQAKSLLKNLIIQRDLPLRTVAYSFRAAGSDNTVIVATDSTSTAKLTAVSYAFINEKGQIIGQWDADAADLATSPVVSATTIAPGSYRLRVAAASEGGRLGAVDYEFKVGLIDAGPLKAGGLMLGRMVDARFIPQIDFSDEPEVSVYLEVYGKVPVGEKATVTIEVATTADGPAIQTVPGAISDTRDADRWIATAELPIASLASGDHVVRAIVRIGAESGVIVRTLRKR